MTTDFPVREGRYQTRHGKVAIIHLVNSTMADGTIKGLKSGHCWWTRNGKAGRHDTAKRSWASWDLMYRIED